MLSEQKLNLRTEVFIFFSLIFIAGCATWSKHQIRPLDSGKFRIALLPLRSAVKIKRLKEIQSVPKNFVPIQPEELLIQEQMGQVLHRLTDQLSSKLEQSGRFEVVPQDKVQKAFEELKLSTGAELNSQEIIALGKSLDVQALLRVNLGGYGKVKKKWIAWLIGTSFPEAVVQGILTIEATGNFWAAVGVGAEDVVQEMFQWGGGAFVFNRIFTPVILDSRLYSVSDGKKIWSHLSVATINFKALRKLPKQERKKKEVRLDLASQKAIDNLAARLSKTAKRNAASR